MTKDYFLATIFLRIINNTYNLSTYPDQLHIAKLFDKLKGINITNNIKNLINKMRYMRVKLHYIDITDDNHGA